METDLPFRLWVKKRRKALDLTQSALADRVGCSMTLIVKIEAGGRRPSAQIAELLAKALDIPTEAHPDFLKAARGQIASARLTEIPPVSMQEYPTNVPPPPTPLVGREAELADIAGLLKTPECRLITLVGPGGIGKTRLALEIGLRVRANFLHGVYFIALAGISDPEYIPSEIVNSLPIKFDSADDPMPRLLNYIYEKNLLLIFDNFEHVLGGGDLLIDLLVRAPRIKILTSSREPLNLRGEWLFEIRGLPMPDSLDKTEFESNSAVALFAQVARRGQKKFNIRDKDKPAIERICRMADGTPLAIELAAAWTRTLSCEEIAREIEKDLDFLSSSMRDLPERHRSLRAVFDHSWKLLAKNERNALMNLSVFRGGFTRESAKQAAGVALQTLTALIMKSLIQRADGESYELHEVVRQYALRRLEAAGELERAQRRHIAFFTEMAETASKYYQSPQITVWFDRMEREHDNVRAALDYAISLQTGQMARHLGAALWRFWKQRGLVNEGRRWLNAILSLPAADTQEDALLRARVLTGAGSLARIQGDFAQARAMHEECLVVRRKLDDAAGIATTLNSLGVVTMYEGKYAASEVYLQESLQISRALDNRAQIAMQLNNLGVTAMCRGEYEKAHSLHEEARRMREELGDEHAVAGSLGNLGDVLRYQGKYDLAAQVLQKSLDIFQKMGDMHGQVISMNSMARVHVAKGGWDQALAAFCSSLTLNREVGDKIEIATTLVGIAEALEGRGKNASMPDHETRLTVRLLAAVGQLRARVGMPFCAPESDQTGQVLDQLRKKLPAEEFTLEWKRGAAMTVEEAIDAALSYLSQE